MCTLALITIISLLTSDRLLGSMCPGLAEPNNPLACISADACVKFCDSRHLLQRRHHEYRHNVVPDYLVTSFPDETHTVP